MESLAAFPGEWDVSLNRMLISPEELDLSQQFLHHHHQFSSFPPDERLGLENQSIFCPNPEAANMSINGINDDQSLLYSSNIALIDSNFHYNYSQESSQSSDSSGTYYLTPASSNQIGVTNDITMSLNIPPAFPNIALMEDHTTVNVIEDLSTDHCSGNLDGGHTPAAAANVMLPAKELLLKRKFDELELHADQGDGVNTIENTKKRTRVSKMQAPKKNRGKINLNGNEGDQSNNIIIGSDGQSSSSCCSDEDNVSQETNGNGVAIPDSKNPPALNLSGKTRARRGSATDPQSLYARKRRERINERLRILQNLVPNGTKVDISTMLEEAVHYVKFLQLQIKLLSSDDLWMFAPIAYNGVDVGLNKKISTLL